MPCDVAVVGGEMVRCGLSSRREQCDFTYVAMFASEEIIDGRLFMRCWMLQQLIARFRSTENYFLELMRLVVAMMNFSAHGRDRRSWWG